VSYLNRPAPAVNGALVIQHIVTCDLDDGQVCPPYFEADVIWRVVKQRSGQTLWRRIFLQSSPTTPGATSAGDQSRAP
jgi:hypothetical protein